MKQIKLKIQHWDDRERIILALANSGYRVWTEIEEHLTSSDIYYVIFEIKE